MDPLRKERSICRICHQKWIVQFQRGFFLFLLIHYIFWLIISLDFVTVAQSWVLAATSGKLYGIFTCNSQLSGMVNSTWLLEIKPFLIQCRTVSNWMSVNFFTQMGGGHVKYQVFNTTAVHFVCHILTCHYCLFNIL